MPKPALGNQSVAAPLFPVPLSLAPLQNDDEATRSVSRFLDDLLLRDAESQKSER